MTGARTLGVASSTARTNGVDLSPVSPDTSTMKPRERALFNGYRHAAATADYQRRGVESLCACGGLIVAESPADADIYSAVMEHNASHGHRVWREIHE